MKIKPFNTLILVEKTTEEKLSASGLILQDSPHDLFVQMKVLAVGDLVEKVKVGTVVIGHDIIEPLEPGGKIGFITESHIFGEVLEP